MINDMLKSQLELLGYSDVELTQEAEVLVVTLDRLPGSSKELRQMGDTMKIYGAAYVAIELGRRDESEQVTEVIEVTSPKTL